MFPEVLMFDVTHATNIETCPLGLSASINHNMKLFTLFCILCYQNANGKFIVVVIVVVVIIIIVIFIPCIQVLKYVYTLEIFILLSNKIVIIIII